MKKNIELSLLLIFASLLVGRLQSLCRDEEREALLSFKRSLSDRSYMLLSNWKSGGDCCTWDEVLCNNITGHVIELDFYNFFGIPTYMFNTTSLDATSLDTASLSRLRHLHHLSLTGISFYNANIPQSINSLTSLRSLELSYTEFRGLIPPHLGNLTNLWYLGLSGNQLATSNLLWLSQLSSLKYLYMSDVNLTLATNWLYEINMLPVLSTLLLENCSLQTLPSSLPYSNFSSTIKVLYISWNQFLNSTIPFWLSNMTNLEELNMNDCQLHGMIPSNLLGALKLRTLDLEINLIDGSIPKWIGKMRNLTYLDLSFNNLSGPIPHSLGQINLEYLVLSDNQLQDSLPQLMSSIQFAAFSNNKFSSGIKWYLNANMSYLEVLDLSGNLLSDEISDSICQMPMIVNLHLSHNNLLGEIPKCKGNVSSFRTLSFIWLANNNFLGLIPQWMENLPSLQSLHLSDNNFQGEIPFLRDCSNLITLDLGQNKFTGIIPLWIGDSLSSLEYLCLRSNKLYGSIPTELSKLKGLQILDLADNFLSGSLPKSFKFLNSMMISFNSTIRKLSFTESLMINIKGMEREVTDILPLEIVMDLSCNNLSGEVLIELMSLVGLISLNLSRNQFTGQIPINIGVMQSLEILDLSWNHFSGEIPQSIVKLSGLERLNLSYNQLSGRIPTGNQLDTFDESSYYGNPELCGKPLPKSCDDGDYNIHNGESNSHDDDDNFGLFLGMGIGFTIGLWSILGIILFKKSWEIAYFQFVDNMINNIHVYIAVKVNQWFR